MSELKDDIFALWDELAGFPASACDAALTHLLSRLCSIYGKFGVHNRGALTSLWLGRFPEGG